MDNKRPALELNTSVALPLPSMSTSNFKKALKSPIKMLPAALTSPTKTKPLQKFPPQQEQRSQTLVDDPPMSPSVCVPTLQVQRASGGIQDPFIDHATATWDCCACGTRNHVYVHPGQHPLGFLACDCPHKPCSACLTSGQVKPFLPMNEPAMVPCGNAASAAEGEPGNEIRFGIVCPSCGLSWRAREFGKRFSKTLRKMPSVSLNRAVHLAPVEGRLRKSRSTLVLGNKRIVTPPGKEVPKQAEYVAVRFSGVNCTCGTTISLDSAFCFQIVGEQVTERDRKQKEFWGLWVKEGNSVGWTTTPELKEKGHGTAMLRLGKVEPGNEHEGVSWRVEHPNPLRSAPVVDKTARDSWEEKCDREGWV
ncbi:uncharacterized protein N0V89_012588 [Didymosphaeria variabile]|uniref:Probable double zinc ribbon domain-containing protein n=1 Tax=Didymosphaeria variabile TaxID=1932322 RepID=A0A9W8XBC9_9PLEO|nr:uncharacterized protein N0V89_012588 [Didymosphaeria variabile]KAJ4344844.1 hypothetical protein N0V89_012588 [Didymosphaeria variabile]